MNKKQIIWFFTGILIVAFMGTVFATIKVIFFDCKYGQCIARECIEIDAECEEDNYDPHTGQTLRDCCSEYKNRIIPLRQYLIRQIGIYGLLTGSGLGIALGVFLAGKHADNKS